MTPQRVSRCRVSQLQWHQNVIVSSAGTEIVFVAVQEGLNCKRFGDHHSDYIRSFEISANSSETGNTRIYTASMDCTVGTLDIALSELFHK